MTVAPPQGYTVKHHRGGEDESRTRVINKQRPRDGCNRLLWRDGLRRNEPMKTRPGLELTAAGRTRNEGECRRCSRAKGCYVATNMETISPRLSHFGWLTCAPIVPPPVLPVGPLLNSSFSAGTPAASARRRGWHSPLGFFFSLLVPELISSPVQFLTRNIHSLIPIDVTDGSAHRPLLWVVASRGPPSYGQRRNDSPVGVEDPGGQRGNWEPEINTSLLWIKSLHVFLTE